MKKRNTIIILLVAIVVFTMFVSCGTLTKLFNGEDVTFDDLSADVESIEQFEKEYKAILRDDFTEEEKYYIGRSTSAFVFRNYKLVEDKKLTEYVNKVGQTVALASNKSNTYNGYRFCVFEDEKPNAYATSGGMILISTGMLSVMDSEDELAAVLSHEVEHVVKDHPTQAVKSETKKKALSSIAKYYAAKSIEGMSEDVQKFFNGMASVFDDVLGDVVNSITNGYARDTEFEADRGAVMTMQRAGYNVDSLISMFNKIPHDKNDSNYGSVHPSPEQRIKEVEKEIRRCQIKPHKVLKKRTRRFLKEMSRAGLR